MTTWLVYRDPSGYHAAVEMTAAYPIAIDDARALRKQALAILDGDQELAGMAIEPPRHVVALSAALDAVRQLRKQHLAARSKPRGYQHGQRRQGRAR